MKNLVRAFGILLAGMILGVLLLVISKVPLKFAYEAYVNMLLLYFVFCIPTTAVTTILLALFLESKDIE